MGVTVGVWVLVGVADANGVEVGVDVEVLVGVTEDVGVWDAAGVEVWVGVFVVVGVGVGGKGSPQIINPSISPFGEIWTA